LVFNSPALVPGERKAAIPEGVAALPPAEVESSEQALEGSGVEGVEMKGDIYDY